MDLGGDRLEWKEGLRGKLIFGWSMNDVRTCIKSKTEIPNREKGGGERNKVTLFVLIFQCFHQMMVHNVGDTCIS